MSATPRLSVGLPVYNGERYIRQSIESLLGQSYRDFELVISDNASTDNTGHICREYAKEDSRIHYFRQPHNIGLAPNHNFVVHESRGKLFKWAANDDLYAHTLLERCVAALDEYPDVVLAHSWTAKIDGAGTVTTAFEYPMTTSSPQAPERFRSVLFDSGGDDDYGVMRIDVLRRTAMKESYHHADHTIIAELVLHGRFYQVPDWLYFRREHPGQNSQASIRKRCANMDPRRANRLLHPISRLYAEYVWGYVAPIRRAPLSREDRQDCYRHLARWLRSRAQGSRAESSDPASIDPLPSIALDLVVGRLEGNHHVRTIGGESDAKNYSSFIFGKDDTDI